MLNSNQFRELIIKPSLNDLRLWSESAEELLVFTCAVESDGGTYLKQLNGPALGIYQMEPETYNDIWSNYIGKNSGLVMMLMHNFDVRNMPSEDRLVYDLKYATAMSRIFYKRIPQLLPSADDINGIWEYYKHYYNTPKGSSEKGSSIKKYKRFIA